MRTRVRPEEEQVFVLQGKGVTIGLILVNFATGGFLGGILLMGGVTFGCDAWRDVVGVVVIFTLGCGAVHFGCVFTLVCRAETSIVVDGRRWTAI